jgi:hypothetical protein
MSFVFYIYVIITQHCLSLTYTRIQAFSSYYVLIHTLKLSAPKAARFTIGIFPLFLGYAIFGCAVFSQVSVLFSDLNHACVTLFALTNGDIINDAFEDLGDEFPYLSLIYMYSFISIFIYAVLNIFIAIVEDSFVATKAFQKKYAANKQQQRKLAAKKKAKQLRREQQQQAQQAAIGMPAHAARGGTSSLATTTARMRTRRVSTQTGTPACHPLLPSIWSTKAWTPRRALARCAGRTQTRASACPLRCGHGTCRARTRRAGTPAARS